MTHRPPRTALAPPCRPTGRKVGGPAFRLQAAAALLVALSGLCGQAPAAERPAGNDLYGDPLPPGALARFGTLRLRHPQWATSVAWSPDGKVLASASWDGTVRLWQPGTGRELRRFEGHTAAVFAVAFSPDGRALVSGGNGGDPGNVRVWDVATGTQRLALRGHDGSVVEAVAVSPDGQTFATGGGGNGSRALTLWDLASGKVLRDLGKGIGVTSVAFSPDGKVLAAAAWADSPGGNTVVLWDVNTGEEVRRLEGPARGCGHLSFSPDGRLLAGVGFEQAFVWGAATGKEVRRLPARGWFALAPGGKAVGVGEDRAARVWDVGTGRELARFTGVENMYGATALSADGKTLASAEKGFAIRLWELATGRERRCFRGHLAPVTGLAFTPDGRALLSASEDTTALVWGVTRPAAAPAGALSAKALARLWDDLAAEDAARAWQAVCVLAASPAEAVPFLRERLRPVAEADPAAVARLVADLDSGRFAVRDRAEAELEKLGELAAPALTRARASASAEVRRKAEGLLAKVDSLSPSPERLRTWRAVEALEHAGTAEARRLLEALARGAAGARLTRQARLSLERLSRPH